MCPVQKLRERHKQLWFNATQKPQVPETKEEMVHRRLVRRDGMDETDAQIKYLKELLGCNN